MAKSKPVTPDLDQCGTQSYQYEDIDVSVPKVAPGTGMETQEDYEDVGE